MTRRAAACSRGSRVGTPTWVAAALHACPRARARDGDAGARARRAERGRLPATSASRPRARRSSARSAARSASRCSARSSPTGSAHELADASAAGRARAGGGEPGGRSSTCRPRSTRAYVDGALAASLQPVFLVGAAIALRRVRAHVAAARGAAADDREPRPRASARASRRRARDDSAARARAVALGVLTQRRRPARDLRAARSRGPGSTSSPARAGCSAGSASAAPIDRGRARERARRRSRTARRPARGAAAGPRLVDDGDPIELTASRPAGRYERLVEARRDELERSSTAGRRSSDDELQRLLDRLARDARRRDAFRRLGLLPDRDVLRALAR